MANVDRPTGFSFAKSLTGHAPNVMLRKIDAADRSADTTNNHGDIYVGSALALSSGKIVVADSGDTVIGVCAGIGKKDAVTHGDTGFFNADDLMKSYADLADTEMVIAVIPAEGNLFEVQTATDLDLVIGSLADHSTTAATAHGSRLTGRSTTELVTPVNNDVRVVEDVTTPGNDTTLVNARHLVMFVTIANAQ